MNDDILTLYFYNDGLSKRERNEITAALRGDAALAARYETLERQLTALHEADIQPAPADMVARWHDSIDRAASFERGREDLPLSRPFSSLSFGWGAAVTAALAIGIGIGAWLSAPDAVTPPETAAIVNAVPAEQRGTAFTRGLTVHLQDTREEIGSLAFDASADRTLLVMQIIQQNRLFQRAAEQNDSENLARVLRAFEPILLRLAADDIAPEDAAELREQLAFELKVMLTILERNASKQTHSTEARNTKWTAI